MVASSLSPKGTSGLAKGPARFRWWSKTPFNLPLRGMGSLWEPQRSGLTRALGPGAAVDAIPNVPTASRSKVGSSLVPT
jgi:hypothetical protein